MLRKYQLLYLTTQHLKLNQHNAYTLYNILKLFSFILFSVDCLDDGYWLAERT